jgi:hypothetical protein
VSSDSAVCCRRFRTCHGPLVKMFRIHDMGTADSAYNPCNLTISLTSPKPTQGARPHGGATSWRRNVNPAQSLAIRANPSGVESIDFIFRCDGILKSCDTVLYTVSETVSARLKRYHIIEIIRKQGGLVGPEGLEPPTKAL